jgi:N-acylglucosamine-6-phosphate 2-epimerase
LTTNKTEILEKLKDGIIVSCQAELPEPLAKPKILAALAKSAIDGGAVGIRTNLPKNVIEIKKNIQVPVIAIYKKVYNDSDVFITPTISEITQLKNTAAEIIATDATKRQRPHKEQLYDLIFELKNSNIIAMADVSTIDEGIEAAKLGFDIIGTTLSGYTEYTKDKSDLEQPDFDLIENLCKEIGDDIPVFAEGRIWTPDQCKKVFECGAYAAVVGSAITRPHLITNRFVRVIQNRR